MTFKVPPALRLATGQKRARTHCKKCKFPLATKSFPDGTKRFICPMCGRVYKDPNEGKLILGPDGTVIGA